MDVDRRCVVLVIELGRCSAFTLRDTCKIKSLIQLDSSNAKKFPLSTNKPFLVMLSISDTNY